MSSNKKQQITGSVIQTGLLKHSWNTSQMVALIMLIHVSFNQNWNLEKKIIIYITYIFNFQVCGKSLSDQYR